MIKRQNLTIAKNKPKKKTKTNEQDQIMIARRKKARKTEKILSSISKVLEVKWTGEKLLKHLHIDDLDLLGIFKPAVDFYMKQERMHIEVAQANVYKLTFGKYASQNLKTVKEIDLPYLKWLINLPHANFRGSEGAKYYARILIDGENVIMNYTKEQASHVININFENFIRTTQNFFPHLYIHLETIARAKILNLTKQKKLIQFQHMEYIYYYQMHNLPFFAQGRLFGVPEIVSSTSIRFSSGTYRYAQNKQKIYFHLNGSIDNKKKKKDTVPKNGFIYPQQEYFFLTIDPVIALKLFLQLEECFAKNVFPFFTLIFEYVEDRDHTYEHYGYKILKELNDLDSRHEKTRVQKPFNVFDEVSDYPSSSESD